MLDSPLAPCEVKERKSLQISLVLYGFCIHREAQDGEAEKSIVSVGDSFGDQENQVSELRSSIWVVTLCMLAVGGRVAARTQKRSFKGTATIDQVRG
jgi:hypothetical protein